MSSDEETVPGYVLQSPNFLLKFVGGFQNGLVSHMLEYETDWMEVMVIVLDTLEQFPTSVKSVEVGLGQALEDWVASHPGAELLGIRVNVEIEEKAFFTEPLGRKKIMRFGFTDKYMTEVVFYVKKKVVMKSLREICAAAIANTLQNWEDIGDLEVPNTLTEDLMAAFNDNWTEGYHRDNLYIRETAGGDGMARIFD